MFEPPLNEEPKNNKTIWLGAAVVVIVAAALLIYYSPKSSMSHTAPAERASMAPVEQKADPVHDLQIVSSQMQKDSTGTVAQWVVEIRNVSSTYGYSGISYQTTYNGANNSVISQNNGVIPMEIGPNEEKTAQFSDVQYPAGTSWYQFRVTDAKAAKQ